MYPQGVCRIRKPACAGNGCAIFPIFQTVDWEQKIRRSAADDLFRVSLIFCCWLTNSGVQGSRSHIRLRKINQAIA